MITRSFGSLMDRNARITKSTTKPVKKSFHENLKQKLTNTFQNDLPESINPISPKLTSSIITIEVGRQSRLFAAHEDILSISPYFMMILKGSYFSSGQEKRLTLPDEDAEVFSCILEYLYKGDYSPRIVHDKRHNTWILENALQTSPKIDDRGVAISKSISATIYLPTIGETVLRDTAVYCSANKYGLDELKKLALKKQGLQCGIEVSTILRSARYAYDNTPDTDSRLRAHYLALIIRSRKTFKRSGTMQMEMEMGGKLFFDLFVAMCNHMDDLENLNFKGTPKTI